MKTKYKKVQVSERLPKKGGKYLIYHKGFRAFLQSTYEPDDLEWVNYFKKNIEFWLEEVPDMEDEMREILEQIYLETPNYLQISTETRKEIEQLLTKLKTES